MYDSIGPSLYFYVFMLLAGILSYIVQEIFNIIILTPTIFGFDSLVSPVNKIKWMKVIMLEIFNTLVLDYNPFWNIKVLTNNSFKNDKVTIYMCNHISPLDALLVSKIFRDNNKTFAMLGKGDLWNHNFINYGLLTNQHDIPVNFSKKKIDNKTKWKVTNSEQIIKRANYHLNNGISIIVFPEGSISHNKDEKTGNIIPKDFKVGFFKIAKNKNIPIIPITIKYANKIFNMYKSKKDSSVTHYDYLLNSGDIEMIVGETIYPNNHNLTELIKLTKNKITNPIIE